MKFDLFEGNILFLIHNFFYQIFFHHKFLLQDHPKNKFDSQTSLHRYFEPPESKARPLKPRDTVPFSRLGDRLARHIGDAGVENRRKIYRVLYAIQH